MCLTFSPHAEELFQRAAALRARQNVAFPGTLIYLKKKKKTVDNVPPRSSEELKADFLRARSLTADRIGPAEPAKVGGSWRELPTCQLWLRRAQTWSGPGNADGGTERRFCVHGMD